MQLIVSVTLPSGHPWCLHLFTKPLNCPRSGWVMIVPAVVSPTMIPEPLGTSDVFASTSASEPPEPPPDFDEPPEVDGSGSELDGSSPALLESSLEPPQAA